MQSDLNCYDMTLLFSILALYKSKVKLCSLKWSLHVIYVYVCTNIVQVQYLQTVKLRKDKSKMLYIIVLSVSLYFLEYPEVIC